MAKDEWIQTAMSTDMLVAELLLRFKHSQASSPLKYSSPSTASAFLPLKWSIRLPRSRAVRCDTISLRNKADSTRCSPTTPLSWSDEASPSATADGCEESSRNRSKVIIKNESTSPTTSNSERSRSKKKTFAELEVEECSHLKEKTHLEKEWATVRETFKKQRSTNVSLKQIKLDFNLHSAKSLDASSCGTETSQLHQRAVSTVINDSSNTQATHDHHPQPGSYDASEVVSTRDGFLLPDLNMLPSEEDYGTEMLMWNELSKHVFPFPTNHI